MPIRGSPPLLSSIQGLWAEKRTGYGGLIPPLKDSMTSSNDFQSLDKFGWAASPFTIGLSFCHRMGQVHGLAPHIRGISDATFVDAVAGRGQSTL